MKELEHKNEKRKPAQGECRKYSKTNENSSAKCPWPCQILFAMFVCVAQLNYISEGLPETTLAFQNDRFVSFEPIHSMGKAPDK